jgi:antitoxin MazE
MRRRVRKWGNSLAITIPKVLAREVGLRDGSEVEFFADSDRLIVATLAPSYTLDELIAAIRPSNLHKETDWGPPVGKEVW